MVGDGLQIIGVMIHILPPARLRRAAMPAPISCDHTKALAKEEKHLGIPIVCAQRPPMAKYDRLSATPVFIVDLKSVFGCNVAHFFSFLANFNAACSVLVPTKPSAAA